MTEIDAGRSRVCDEVSHPASDLSRCVVCGTLRDPSDYSSHGTCHGNTARFRRHRFALWQCPDCRTIHSLARVDYEDIYRDYPPTLHQRLDYFARGRFANLLKRLRLAGLERHHRILDVGCGNGAFLDYLRLHGFEAAGYDPYVERFAQLDQSEPYDVVIANDVVEHVDDPKECVRFCSRLVKPDGLLYIGTADAEGVAVAQLVRQELRLHQPFHRVIMTSASLRRIVAEVDDLAVVASYQRSYMDTRRPFVNYRFFDEFSAALDYDMDRAYEPVSPLLFLRRPSLLFFALFGSMCPSADEPALICRRLGVPSAAGSAK